MNHGRKQHDSHMGSKTLAGKQPHGLSKHGNKHRQVCKVNSHWALAKEGPFSFSVWKTSAEQLATLDHHFLVFAWGSLGGGALALHGCRLGLGSSCGLLQLELQPILMEDGPTHLEGIPASLGSGHSSNGRTWSSSGWARVAVAVAMVPLAAGFPRVAAGFFMGMAAGTEAHSGAWASHWCGQSGCRKEMHLNHMV